MLTHFTTVIGVVIAFYFGSEAYLIAHAKKDRKDGFDESVKAGAVE